jgi:hypothetical protein
MSFVRKSVTILSNQEKFLLDHSTSISVVRKNISYMKEAKTQVLSKMISMGSFPTVSNET